jgi:hypothetical protein
MQTKIKTAPIFKPATMLEASDHLFETPARCARMSL